MAEDEPVGQYIRRLRLERGLTLAELGTLADINHTAISKIENGHANPTRRTLRDLARGLKVKPEDLYRRAGR